MKRIEFTTKELLENVIGFLDGVLEGVNFKDTDTIFAIESAEALRGYISDNFLSDDLGGWVWKVSDGDKRVDRLNSSGGSERLDNFDPAGH